MPLDYGTTLVKSISRQIKRSRKPVTILFTDIEDSTRYWDRHGDVQGRLMVDQHNRLVFPVIRRYRGRIVKTIGDSVMAVFKDPDMAIQASIGIQQALEARRQQDRKFKLKIRIGLHTGKALVEHTDVYGDVVNVAARVESFGKGNEILVSGATAQKISSKTYHLTRRSSYTPKGKSKSITVYRCNWKKYHNLVDTVEFSAFLPMVPRQKFEVLGYALASISIVVFLYLKYWRYVVADSERLALLTLNPADILAIHPLVPWILVLLGGAVVVVIAAASTVPHIILRGLKGGFGFALVFSVANALVSTFPDLGDGKWNSLLYQSDHLYVEIAEDNVSPLLNPDMNANLYQRAGRDGSVKPLLLQAGDLLLLTDVRSAKGIVWNKVLVASNQYAWLPRILPPAIGRAEQRVTTAYKFYFRRMDVVLLLAGLVGFVWGFANFRIRPI
jgi:class 3 adenylate cyclase